MRRMSGWADKRILGLVILLSAHPLIRLSAQDTVQVRDTITVPDSVPARRRMEGDSVRPRPPVSPGRAFVRSLLVPGWGQSTMHRHLTAGLFVAFEGVAVTMVWKSGWQRDYNRVRGYEESHRQEQQDWIVLWIFNHFFSGAEALVAAHLYDFPAALTMQALPSGDVLYGVSVQLPR